MFSNKVMSMMVVTMMVFSLSPVRLSGSELTLGAGSVISSGGGSSSGGIYGATVSISGAGATGTPNVSADYSLGEGGGVTSGGSVTTGGIYDAVITMGSASVPAFTFELTADNVFDLAEVWLYEADDLIFDIDGDGVVNCEDILLMVPTGP